MKLFKEVKRIQSKTGELHFVRFAIFESKLFSIYIHKIHKADKDDHLHNHPWKWCAGMVLWGYYIERYGLLDNTRIRKFPNISVMKPSAYHKIDWLPDSIIPNKKDVVITLFIAGPRLPTWGYLVDGKHIDFETYRKQKHGKLS